MNEQSLFEKVQNANEESYNKWFERWYKKQNIENKILAAANQGYTGFIIRIKYTYESESRYEDDKKYLVRRLRDDRTPQKIEEKLGDGFTVQYKKNEYEKNIFGIESVTTEEYISIDWGYKNE